MIPLFATIILMSALLLTMFCFFLVVQPSRVLMVIVHFAGVQEDWHQGVLDTEREQELYYATRRVEKIVIFALFGWCFCCGAILALFEILI